MKLYASNHLETLSTLLAEDIRSSSDDPLAVQRIVVPHPVLGHWLTLDLARQLGVAANLSFELPAAFAWSLMREAMPELPRERSPYAPELLRWRIFEALPAFQESADGGMVQTYLTGTDDRSRFELADRLARIYDRCLLYRPAWIRAWQGGEQADAPDCWHGSLWRQLIESDEAKQPQHWVTAVDAYKRLSLGDAPQGQRTRVRFFGVGALSPAYLDLLRHASTAVEVGLYMLSPCQEYWGDIRQRRERGRLAELDDGEDDYFTEGNELLAAWGKAARDMQYLLADSFGFGDPVEEYAEPAGQGRLAIVQSDILNLRLAEGSGGSDQVEEVLADEGYDNSIEIHVCHSPIREAEVLHDRLLGLFDANPNLQPADVLVLVPNLDDYASAIEAVFAAEGKIPHNINQPRHLGNAVQAFLNLLALPGSRYGINAVLAPLAAARVQARFDVDVAGLADLRHWLHTAGVRWGIDEAHRKACSGTEFSGFDWRQGIRRLLLGYAVDQDATLVHGIAPAAIGRFDDPAPADYELLGRLLHYCELSFKLNDLHNTERPPAEWARFLRTQVVEPFFSLPPSLGASDADAWRMAAEELGSVHGLIDDFANECDQAGANAPLAFSVLRDVLGDLAVQAFKPKARLADGVTVARLAAGEIYPAEILCALGMNNGQFPRCPTALSFDPIAANGYRRGDRDDRDEDRLAFLEALLAARQHLLISYTGRDLHTDRASPPSPVVSELLDYLQARFGRTDAIIHPLQPFSVRYFDGETGEDERLFSYSSGMCAAALALAKQRRRRGGQPQNRFDGLVAETRNEAGGTASPSNARKRMGAAAADPGSSANSSDVAQDLVRVDLDELIRFCADPCQSFLRNRLGLNLALAEELGDEDEPFELDSLQKWALKNESLELANQGMDLTDDLAGVKLFSARGQLPLIGQRQTYQAAATVATSLRHALHRFAPQQQAPVTRVAVEISNYQVTGTVNCYADGTLLWWRVGKIRARHRIEAWLQLLALASQEDGPPPTACLVGEGHRGGVEEACLKAPDNAEDQLEQWLDLWREGQRRLMPFYPETSWEFTETERKGKDDARDKAQRKWDGGFSGFSESVDPYAELVWGDTSPLDDPTFEEFAKLADCLLDPILAAGDPDGVQQAAANPSGSSDSKQ